MGRRSGDVAAAIDKARHLRPAERDALGFGEDANKHELSGLRFKMWKEQFRERYFGEPRERMIEAAAIKTLPGGRVRPSTAGPSGRRLVRRIDMFSKHDTPEVVATIAAGVSTAKLEALGLHSPICNRRDTPASLYPIPSRAEGAAADTRVAVAADEHPRSPAVAAATQPASEPTARALEEVRALLDATEQSMVHMRCDIEDEVASTPRNDDAVLRVTAEVKRVDAFRDSLRELVRECDTGLRDFVRLITNHYDSAIHRLVSIVCVSERRVMGETLTNVQSEALRLQTADVTHDKLSQELAQSKQQLDVKVQQLSMGLCFSMGAVNRLGRQIESVCKRLFRSPPEAPHEFPHEVDAAWDDDAHTAAGANTEHLEKCVKGLFDEIVGVRKDNYALTQRVSQMLYDYNDQQRLLNDTRQTVARLKAQVAALGQQLSDAQDEIDGHVKDKADLNDQLTQMRVMEQERDVLLKRRKNDEMLIGHYREILSTFLDKRDVKAEVRDSKGAGPQGMLRARGSFLGVPKFLRTKAAKVKNRMLTKASTLQHVKEIWDMRAKVRSSLSAVALLGGVSDTYPFEDTVAELCSKQQNPIEFGYSLVDACERFAPVSLDCELFVGCVEGTITDEVALQCGRFVDHIRGEIERLSRSAAKQGKIGHDVFVRLIRTTAQGDVGMFLRCMATLHLEKSSMELMEIDQDIQVYYPRLYDSLRRSYYIASHATWLDISTLFLDALGGKEPKTLPLSEVKRILRSRDPFNTAIDDMLRAALGKGTTVLTASDEPEEEIHIPTLLANLYKRGLMDYRLKDQKVKRLAKRAQQAVAQMSSNRE